MTDKKDDGGPAFPRKRVSWRDCNGEAVDRREYSYWEGMSLRDWFAGMALQGMYASDTENWNNDINFTVRAENAYKAAEAMLAMLKERSK